MVRQSSPQVVQHNSAQVVKTRIPPSPTGIPHIGNTRTALFNYLFAKHHGGQFILRIEDTDRARFVKDAEKAIIEILKWLDINWDGDIERQSNRLGIYKVHAEKLKKKELVYEDSGALRFKMPKTGQTTWNDAVGNKTITFENKTQEDFVIIKSDGYPTYNFANVIDDHLMEITHVLRGDEFISSTPKHIQLYQALGWNMPVFGHLPVILGHDRQKLSKRHGAKSALDFRDEGYLKDALLNYMVLLGWNPGGDKEIMTLSEMIKLFDLKDINTTSPVFDLVKLKWMNQQYIQKMSDSELKGKIKEFYPQTRDLPIEILDSLIPLAKSRMETLIDFEKLTGVFFNKIEHQDFNPDEKRIAQNLLKELSKIKDWKHEAIFNIIKEVMTINKLRMPVFYKLLTGEERGLPLPETLEILGRKKALDRLEEILRK